MRLDQRSIFRTSASRGYAFRFGRLYINIDLHLLDRDCLIFIPVLHIPSTARMATNSSATSRRQPSSTAVSSRTKDSLAPKPPCSIHPSAIISDKAIITGTHPVTIGEGCVIHPFAKITSAVAPVRIGNNSIIAERTTVGLIAESSASEDAAVTIEENVSIESGAVVEAVRIGTGSVVEVNARLGPRATVGKVRPPIYTATLSSGRIIGLICYTV